jgi:hypothetical protein
LPQNTGRCRKKKDKTADVKIADVPISVCKAKPCFQILTPRLSRFSDGRTCLGSEVRMPGLMDPVLPGGLQATILLTPATLAGTTDMTAEVRQSSRFP